MAKVSINKIAQDTIDAQVVALDEALEGVEERLSKYQKLIEAKTKLLAARRALLGTGSRNTGNAGTRLTLDDVVAYLKKHPGSVVSSVAEEFGVSQSTVSSHIYRNKDRFIKKGGVYYARDPEAGIDTADDIEEE